MVTLNTRTIERSRTTSYENIEFKYLIDVPRCDCIFGSAKEPSSGKALLFLVFNHRGKIYRRNGLSGSWIELKSDEEYSSVRERLLTAIADKGVPCYTTASKVHLS